MAQGQCCDYVWKGDGGEDGLKATSFSGKAPPSQQKVAQFPGFVARRSEFEFSSSSHSCKAV